MIRPPRFRIWFSRSSTAPALPVVGAAAGQFVLVYASVSFEVAVPRLASDLRLSGTDLREIVAAYPLMFGSLLVLGGRLGDRLGHARAFCAGMLSFGAASTLGASSQTAAVLVVARAAAGMAAAVALPSAVALASTASNASRDRDVAFALAGAAAATSVVLGSLTGGFLMSEFGWRAVLLVTAPPSFACGFWALTLHPASVGRRHVHRRSRESLLVPSLMLLITVGVSAARSLRAVEICSALFVALAFQTRRRHLQTPLVPGTELQRRMVVRTTVANAGASASNNGVLVVAILYVQRTLGWTPLQSSLLLAGVGVAAAVGAAAVPRLLKAFSAEQVMRHALFLQGAGMGVMAACGAPLFLGAGMTAAGSAYVIVSVVAGRALADTASGAEQAAMSGWLNGWGEIGAALGIAALVAVAGPLASSQGSGAPPDGAAVAHFRLSAAVGSAMSVCAATALPRLRHFRKSAVDRDG